MSAAAVPRPFRFALQFREMADRLSVADQARRAEDLGYEEVFSHDHIGAPDPFAPLMVAAGATERLRIGPLVLNNELHHPVLLARTLATVDLMSDGRLVAGFGTGYSRDEHEAAGIELRPPGPRVDRLEESLTLLRSLLDRGAGRSIGADRVDVADLGVQPCQDRVPFLVGGHGRRVVAVAARHADVYQLTGLEHGPRGEPQAAFGLGGVRKRVAWLSAGAGERAGTIELSALVQQTEIGADVGSARSAAAGRLGGDGGLVDETPFMLIGSVAEVVEKLQRLRAEIGLSHVVVRDAVGFAPVVATLAGT